MDLPEYTTNPRSGLVIQITSVAIRDVFDYNWACGLDVPFADQKVSYSESWCRQHISLFFTLETFWKQIDLGRINIFSLDISPIKFDLVFDHFIEFPAIPLAIDSGDRRMIAHLFGEKPVFLGNEFVGLS